MAFEHSNEALNVYYTNQLDNTLLLIEIKHQKVISLIAINKIEEAIKTVKSILELNKIPNSIETKCRCFNELGRIYRRKGEYFKALEAFNKVKKFQEQINTSNYNFAITSQNIGAIFFFLENYKVALDYFQEALRYLKDEEDVLLLKNIIKSHICEIYLHLEDFNEVNLEKEFEGIISNFEKQGIFFQVVHTETTLATFYLKTDEFEKAEQTAKKALNICKLKDVQATELHIYCYNILFKKNLKTNNLEKAIHYGELILQLQENLQTVDKEVVEMMEDLVYLYHRTDDNKNGLRLAILLVSFFRFKTSHFSATNSFQLF